jgi:replicative DNA helicase
MADMGEMDRAASRVPPHSVEAEQSVLGAVLLDNLAFNAIGDKLQAADFYLGEHRAIWRACAELILAHKPADIITVFLHLQSAGQDEAAGGLVYLNRLAESVPSARNAARYADIVRQRALCRKLVRLAHELDDAARQAAGPGGDVAALIDRTALQLLDLQQGAPDEAPVLIGELLPRWLDELSDRAEGKTDAIPLGYRDLDRKMAGGARRGELVVVGARPSMGKSAFVLRVARTVAQLGPVLKLTMEDSASMLVSRHVAAAGRVNLADIRSPQHAPDTIWQGVEDGTSQLAPLKLYVDDRPALELADVRRKALQVKGREGDLLLIVADYLQLMEGDGESRAQELTKIARGLKRLAKELNCVVLVLSQLSREADKTDNPPRLDHLAESGGIEQAADVIGLLWREARRKPKPGNEHSAQIELVKNKNGATCTVPLEFFGATQRFEDAAREYDHA